MFENSLSSACTSMAVFVLERHNPSRRTVRLSFYSSSVKTGRTMRRRSKRPFAQANKKSLGTTLFLARTFKMAAALELVKLLSRKRKETEEVTFCEFKRNEDMAKKILFKRDGI